MTQADASGRHLFQYVSVVVEEIGCKVRLGAVVGLTLLLAGCSIGGAALPGSDLAKRTIVTGSLPDRATGSSSKSGVSSGRTATAAALPARPGTRIALLLPLSGPGELAVLAKAMQQSAELALFEAGGAGLQLIVKDDKGTPEGARAAAEAALRDGAEILLGPLLASSVDAVRPVASTAGKSVIAFSNDRRVAGRGVHLLSYLPDHDVGRIVSFAASRGHRRFAALVPGDDYGRIVESALTRAVTASGGRLIAAERYVSNGTGMLEPARRLSSALQAESASPEDRIALLLPGAAEQLASLGPLLTYTGLDVGRVRLLGTSGWDQAELGRDKAFVGAWYPAPERAGWARFAGRFAATFGRNPPRLAGLAYDAMGVAVALSADRTNDRFSSAAIMRRDGFKGVDGALRFNPDGTAERTLAIHEVQAIGAVVIDPPEGKSPERTRISAATSVSN